MTYFRPDVGVILIAADVVIPTAIAAVLLTAILRGSDVTCERVFRLLRWISNRPEPLRPPRDGDNVSEALGSRK